MYSSTVQALRLCTGRKAHRGSRGIALLFLDHATRRWWGVSVTLRPFFTPGKDPVPIVQEVGWDPGPAWTGAENLVSTEIDHRTVQPVAIRYSDWATRLKITQKSEIMIWIFFVNQKNGKLFLLFLVQISYSPMEQAVGNLSVHRL